MGAGCGKETEQNAASQERVKSEDNDTYPDLKSDVEFSKSTNTPLQEPMTATETPGSPPIGPLAERENSASRVVAHGSEKDMTAEPWASLAACEQPDPPVEEGEGELPQGRETSPGIQRKATGYGLGGYAPSLHLHDHYDTAEGEAHPSRNQSPMSLMSSEHETFAARRRSPRARSPPEGKLADVPPLPGLPDPPSLSPERKPEPAVSDHSIRIPQQQHPHANKAADDPPQLEPLPDSPSSFPGINTEPAINSITPIKEFELHDMMNMPDIQTPTHFDSPLMSPINSVFSGGEPTPRTVPIPSPAKPTSGVVRGSSRKVTWLDSRNHTNQTTERIISKHVKVPARDPSRSMWSLTRVPAPSDPISPGCRVKVKVTDGLASGTWVQGTVVGFDRSAKEYKVKVANDMIAKSAGIVGQTLKHKPKDHLQNLDPHNRKLPFLWTNDDVLSWLGSVDMEDWIPTFKVHGLDGRALLYDLDYQMATDSLKMDRRSIKQLNGYLARLRIQEPLKFDPKLQEVFCFFDSDGDGLLTYHNMSELKQMCEDVACSEDDFRELCNAYDIHDETLNFMQFSYIFQDYSTLKVRQMHQRVFSKDDQQWPSFVSSEV